VSLTLLALLLVGGLILAVWIATTATDSAMHFVGRKLDEAKERRVWNQREFSTTTLPPTALEQLSTALEARGWKCTWNGAQLVAEPAGRDGSVELDAFLRSGSTRVRAVINGIELDGCAGEILAALRATDPNARVKPVQ
jgi:hypothetical protein